MPIEPARNDRAKDMAASEIRALFAVAARPEIVSLAGGMPCVTALPLDTLDTAGRGPGSLCRDLLRRAAVRGI